MDGSALLPNVPDVPNLVEARGMLLSGEGIVLWTDGASAVLHSPEDLLACVVGPVPAAALAAALSPLPRETEVVIGEEDAARSGLPSGWTAEAAVVHIAPEHIVVPPTPGCEVRLLDVVDPLNLSHVPADLRSDLEDAFLFAPLAATFVADTPVAFCRVGWVTETWWDVAIDTLEPWRSRGCATAAAAALMESMRSRGKRAVWSALVSNVPSLRLAARLGFTPVSRVLVFSRYTRPPVIP
jgi:GNAT superfamily N-acetyltransferase